MKRLLLGALAATTVVSACARPAPSGVREQPSATLEEAPTASVPLATPPTSSPHTPTVTLRERAAPVPPRTSPAPSTARTPVPSATASPPVTTTPTASARPCTDLFSYAGDPRSAEEINSVGWLAGACPAPQRR
ncbi:hypothetical protein [Rhodococcus sp. X156]|uniref:hypothetical protein n=1 Tax=Rhodococcus sp. X156 TaxID=2499145 RepID=UPI000FDA67BC|nr:hypothetical protein [Rhodococcus sp. X156]